MAHGGYGRRRIAQRGRVSRWPRGLIAERKPKSVSLKNLIRSVEHILLRKNLPAEVRDDQEKRLQELKRQHDIQNRSVIEHKLSVQYRGVKFFERRKIERRIRRLERLQRTADHVAQEQIAQQLSQLREDLEYVRKDDVECVEADIDELEDMEDFESLQWNDEDMQNENAAGTTTAK